MTVINYWVVFTLVGLTLSTNIACQGTAHAAARDVQEAGASSAWHPQTSVARARVSSRNARTGSSAALDTSPSDVTGPGRDWSPYSLGPTGAWISLGSVDPQGRWVFFCQTTEKFEYSSRSAFLDTRFVPFFAQYNGECRAAEVLLATSPSGRYVVLLSRLGPELLDIETGTALSLASRDLDLRADALPGDLRSVAFSPKSDRIALLVHEKQPRVVVLDLVHQSESEVTPVGDTVWRIGFDASGQYLVLQEVIEDGNRNGRLSWPVPQRKLTNTRCRTRIPAFPIFSTSGDRPELTIAPVSGGKARVAPGFITGLGRGVIVKEPNGTLSVLDGGHARGFASPDCDAQIVAVAPESERILVGCRDGKGRAQLEIDSANGVQLIDLDVAASSVDNLVTETERYTPIYSGSRSAVVDLTAARLLLLEDRDQVLAQGAAGIVIRRNSTVVLYDPDSKKQTRLLDSVPAGTRVVMGNEVVALGRSVVSAAQGRVLGKLEKPALALASNGCGLIEQGEVQSPGLLPRGPLTWSCPSR